MSLREKAKKADEFFVITHLVSRHMAYPIALVGRRLGISANAVTITGGVAWVVSAVTVVVGGWALGSGQIPMGWWLLLTTAVLWNIGYILDVADGSLARMTDSASAAGFYLDFVFHLVYCPMFLASIGTALYLTTSQMGYLILAVLSITANWGVSFAATQHVVCHGVGSGSFDVSSLTDEERYAFFMDVPHTRVPVGRKGGPGRLALTVVREMIGFPGQFAFFGAILVADFIVGPRGDAVLPILSAVYPVVAGVMLVRVPFRIRREFGTMRRFDKVMSRLAQTHRPHASAEVTSSPTDRAVTAEEG